MKMEINNSYLAIDVKKVNETHRLTITDTAFLTEGLKKFLNIKSFDIIKANASETSTEVRVEGFSDIFDLKDKSVVVIAPKAPSTEKLTLTVSLGSLTLKQLYRSDLLPYSLYQEQIPDIGITNIVVKIGLETQEVLISGVGAPGPLKLGLRTPALENPYLSVSAKFDKETILFWEAGLEVSMTLGRSKLKVLALFPQAAYGWKFQLASSDAQFLEGGMEDIALLMIGEDSFPTTLLPPNLVLNNKPALKELFVDFNYGFEVFSRLEFTLHYDIQWHVFENESVTVSGLETSFSYCNYYKNNKPYSVYNGRLIAKALVFGIQEEIEIPLPPIEGAWKIRTLPKPGTITLGSISKRLESILGKNQLLDMVPPELANLGNDFNLNSLELALSPSSPRPLSVAIDIGTQKRWMLPYLEKSFLDRIRLEFFVAPAVSISETDIFGRVYGNLIINKAALSIFIQKLQGASSWSMGLDIKEARIGLPEIAELVGLNRDILNSYLPSSLSVLKDLKLIDFSINYDFSKKTLTDVALEIALTEPWKLLEDKVVVDNLNFDFEIIDPLQPKTRQVKGSFLGVIKLGDFASFYIAADNEGKDWLLEGGSSPDHPIHITKLLKHFFEWLNEEQEWPEVVPQVDLRKLMVSYHTGGTQALAFGAELNITLKQMNQYLGDFFSYAELNTGLQIISARKSATDSKRELAGKLEGKVALGEHLKFDLTYEFLPNNHTLSLLMGKQALKLQKESAGTFLIADINNLSIGDIVTSILQQVSDTKKLPFPFDILNLVGVDHLTLKVNLAKRKAMLLPTNHARVIAPSLDENLFSELPDVAVGDSPDAIRTIWIPIQRALGPLYFERIGIQSAGKSLRILFDASFSYSGLMLELAGFSFAFPLKDPKEFDWNQMLGLDGVGVSFCRGPVQLLGALLKSKDPEVPNLVDYMGEISIKAQDFGFSALGAYASIDGSIPSVCAFVSVNIPIGGPPYLSLKGLAGGFGVNRDLRLPATSEIISYPLVKGAMGEDQSFNNRKPLDGLKALGKYLKPSIGRCWLAAGIKISSMEMIEAFGLLTICLGTKLEVAFLGVGRVTLPKGASEPVFKGELALQAVFSLDQFLISFGGELTPSSFIFSPSCHITGGFNYSLWFGPPHLGDFVITFGGFNPYLERPAHYPNPPRLGLNWQYNENLVIKGGAYYALTPKRVMVGGELELTWKGGGLDASFMAQMHFIISWLPYYFEGRIPIHIAASYELNTPALSKKISFNAEALLEVRGPVFSGKGVINIYFLSFAFSFGPTPTPPEPIAWEDFKASFLPQPKPSKLNQSSSLIDKNNVNKDFVCTIRMSQGIIKELEGGEKGIYWIADSTASLIVSTVVPVKEAKVNSVPQDTLWDKNFGIGMMGVSKEALQSTLDITLAGQYASQPRFKVDHLSENMSNALWGESGVAFDEKAPALKTNLLSGFRLSSYIIPSEVTVPVRVENLLYHTPDPVPTKGWSKVQPPREGDFDQTQAFATIMKTLKDTTVMAKREKLLQGLREQGLELVKDIHTQEISERVGDVFFNRPTLSYLGEEV